MNTKPSLPETLPASRSGIKTTEFWLVLLVNLIVATMTYFEQVPGAIGIIVMGVLTLIYNSLRTSIKTKLLAQDEV